MDQQLLFLINREWTTPALDWLMVVMSSLSLWQLPLALLIAVVAFKGRFRARAMLVVLAITIALGDGVVTNGLKKALGRPRPHQSLAGVRQLELAKTKPPQLALAKPLKAKLSGPAQTVTDGRSFPSAHTVNNLCAAVIVTAFYKRRGWLMFIPALLVAYSRIYVGSHWPSDILASLLIGTGFSLALLALFKTLWRRFGPRFVPNLQKNHPDLIP